ncbi:MULTISPECIES: hypothetical protein [unclassified Microbacterium]|uniref:hypothetical protein n=1 Tax=unclassified Microbacterium TaxID=2609290 RepID=UPI000EA95F98|nr:MULTISPECIES: hypothetical protein [unclassified Microbacterium]MBT2484111.1 hypothetical protein [Microbacterium sp. ISL-108]RKN67057.1 hypothetical protein D7252_05305 [Microbacterium sp. CGR2]
MSNPQAFANNQDPLDGTFRAGTFPTDTYAEDALQPETQGDEPLEAELGEDGEGDLAPEDQGTGHSGDAPTDLRDGTE